MVKAGKTKSTGASQKPHKALLVEEQKTINVDQYFWLQDLSPSTQRNYQIDWSVFRRYCEDNGHILLPATIEAVVLFIEHQQRLGKSASTINRRLAAIRHVHASYGYEPPTKAEAVTTSMKRVRARAESLPNSPHKALQLSELHAILKKLDLQSLQGLRDRALLCIGFYSGAKRSELVGLHRKHLSFHPKSMQLTIITSEDIREVRIEKTTKYCPVTALRAWLQQAQIKEGPVFRKVHRSETVSNQALSPQSVTHILKRACLSASLDPEHYSAHSLRAGFVRWALSAGIDIEDVQQQSGYKTITTLQKSL